MKSPLTSNELLITNELQRWRLLLGEAAQGELGARGALSADLLAADAALEWLYGRDPERVLRGERNGGSGASQLTTPDWINAIQRLFPQEVIEHLELDAVERYGIDDVVTNLEVLERIEPSESLLRAVLQTKHLMNPDVLAAARQLVVEVVRRIMERLATQVQRSFSGSRDRHRPSSIKIARNFDFKRTLVNNLHRWSPQHQKLFIDAPAFVSRVKKNTERWEIILLIDQSGSMVDSVIHAAVMAACLWNLPGMETRLIAFDSEVVDLTADVADPVELLMKVQLGGGTNIAKAVAYAQQLISHPTRSIIVLVSDFYEGGSSYELITRVRNCVQAGSKFLGLAALDASANPCYDKETATRMVAAGAQVGAMTPGELAAWLAEKVKG